MKYRILIKVDSEAFVAASLLWVDLIVCHHKTSNILRLALYQIINRNWQKYKRGLCPSLNYVDDADAVQAAPITSNSSGGGICQPKILWDLAHREWDYMRQPRFNEATGLAGGLLSHSQQIAA